MESGYLIYVLVGLGIFTVYMAVLHLLRRDRMRDRLKSTPERYRPDRDDGAPPASAAFCEGVLSLFGINTVGQKPLALLMLQAGIQSPYAVAYYLFFKRIIQPLLLLAGAALFVRMLAFSHGLTGLQMAQGWILALMFMTFGLFGANLYITNCKQHRQQKLLRAFPEALDLLLVCIESGLGLDAAIARVCAETKESHPEITQELERTRIELTVMSDRSQALQNLAERTDLLPFKSLVASLIQTEKFGTSLLDTLRVLSEDQRVARLLDAENRAARIPVLITIPLIVCTLPALFIVILGPPIVKVIEQGGIFGSKTPK